MAEKCPRGWQVNRPILDCHKYMYDNQVACDMRLVFPSPDGTSVVIQTHKYILVCRSPVFEAMLCGDFTESSNTVTITDIEPDIFQEVLRYMYYDQADLSDDNVLHVMFAAKKYILGGLEKKCSEFLQEQLSVENLPVILNYSLVYDESQLVDRCLDLVATQPKDVLTSDAFLQLSHDALHSVLACDQVCLASEVGVYKACLRWAKHKQSEFDPVQTDSRSLRDILGKCIYQIRFISMTNTELLEVADEDILSTREQVSFLQLLNRGAQGEAHKVHISNFNLNRRKSKLPIQCATDIRFNTIERSAQFWRSGHDRLSFTINKRVVFRGITWFGGYYKGDKHTVTLTLWEGSTVLCCNKLHLVSDGTSNPMTLEVSEPQALAPDNKYTIEANSCGPFTFYGEGGQECVGINDLTVTFYRSDGPSNGTTHTRGQIPQILLSTIL